MKNYIIKLTTENGSVQYVKRTMGNGDYNGRLWYYTLTKKIETAHTFPDGDSMSDMMCDALLDKWKTLLAIEKLEATKTKS